MTREETARVLDAHIALEQRFYQIAQLAEDADYQTQKRCLYPVKVGLQGCWQSKEEADEDGPEDAADGPFPGFTRAAVGGQMMLA